MRCAPCGVCIIELGFSDYKLTNLRILVGDVVNA